MSIFKGPVGKTLIVMEGLALDAFTPGQLVVQSAPGGNKSFATTGVAATVNAQETLIVKEVPSTLGGSDTTPVTVGDTAEIIVAEVGQYVLMSMITGQALSFGSPIASNADGDFKLGTPATETIFAYSEVVVTTTANQQLVLCRIA